MAELASTEEKVVTPVVDGKTKMTKADFDVIANSTDPENDAKASEMMAAIEAGTLEIVEKIEETPAVPEGEKPLETTTEPSKTPEVPVAPAETAGAAEEFLEVKIKKEDLHGHSSVQEALKSLREAQNYSAFTEKKARELGDKIGEYERLNVAGKEELESVKTEREDLLKRIEALEKAPAKTEPTPEIKPVDVQFDIPTDPDMLTLPENQEKLFGVTKKALEKIAILEQRLASQGGKPSETSSQEVLDMRKEFDEFKKTAKSRENLANAEIEQKKQDTEFENTLAKIDGFQNKEENKDFKTVLPFKDLNEKYIEFKKRVGFALGHSDQTKEGDESTNAALSRYFFDKGLDGDAVRTKLNDIGVRPPDETDKYFKLLKVKQLSDEKGLTLKQAKLLIQDEEGILQNLTSTARAEGAEALKIAAEKQKEKAALVPAGAGAGAEVELSDLTEDDIQKLVAKENAGIALTDVERQRLDAMTQKIASAMEAG